jgi:hypothetical protein
MVGEGNPPTAWQVTSLSLCVDTQVDYGESGIYLVCCCRFLVPIHHSMVGEGKRNSPTAGQVTSLSLCVHMQVDYGESGIPGMLAVDSWCLSTTLLFRRGIPPLPGK